MHQLGCLTTGDILLTIFFIDMFIPLFIAKKTWKSLLVAI